MSKEGFNSTKLKVTGLSKRYDEPPVQALKDVNFEVNDGDFFCIIGPSGCGKSTTLRLIAGFEPPTEGQVLLDGREVEDPGPDRAMVFQDLNQLFPWKTTLKNVVYPLVVNKLYSNNKLRFEAGLKYLRMVGLGENFDSAFPHQLSGGMKQRVAIARALALDPKVLLMDEPFGSIDAQTRTGLQVELLRIWEETQKTILFVTHNIEEAILLGTKILVLGTNPGRVLQLFDNPIPPPRIATDPGFSEFWKKLYNLLGHEDE
ncbi:MAG: ABC transporter ATP-binding protein [Desulfobacteraceae bacterium]|jgi:NitT/TauT family transport system ATP-binding protein